MGIVKDVSQKCSTSVPVDPGELEHLEDQYWEQVAELEATGEQEPEDY